MLLKKKKECPYCGMQINGFIACLECLKDLKKLVNEKFGKTENCFSFTAPFLYKDIVREAILNFKFHEKIEYCKSFCYFMASFNFSYFDVLVYVPKFEKEFNSSKEIAKVLTKTVNIKFCNDGLKKIKQTKSQHNCQFKDRFFNLKDAFKGEPKRLYGKNVLICDDVITTSSTIEEAAKAAKKAGAKNVGAISFAASEKLF